MKKAIKSRIIILIILAIIIFLLLIFNYVFKDNPEDILNLFSRENTNLKNNEELSELSSYEPAVYFKKNTILNPSSQNLPQDINTMPCGFYTEEYGVCAGTCPAGECVQEGRSCYCKEI
jgi:hypothetical protein